MRPSELCSSGDIARAARRAQGQSEYGAVQLVADRLGLNQGWVSRLCDISMSLDISDRNTVEKSGISAKAAASAKDFGGKTYLQTLAKQATEAKINPNVVRPNEHTVTAMRKALAAAPESARDQLKKDIVTGKIQTPDEAPAVLGVAQRLSNTAPHCRALHVSRVDAAVVRLQKRPHSSQAIPICSRFMQALTPTPVRAPRAGRRS